MSATIADGEGARPGQGADACPRPAPGGSIHRGCVSTLYAIRPATDAEREKVGASWRTMLTLHRDREAGSDVDEHARTRMVGLDLDGSRGARRPCQVARGWLVRAIHGQIDLELWGDDACSVVVADHPDAPGFPLGWLAYREDPFTLLAVHVEAHARGQWVGRELLRHAMHARPEPRCTLLTPAGRRLLEHVRAGLAGGEAAA